jgi:hypothetical protein
MVVENRGEQGEMTESSNDTKTILSLGGAPPETKHVDDND